jgi:hypothetical protein
MLACGPRWALVGPDHASHCAKPVDCKELASKCACLGRSVSTVIGAHPLERPAGRSASGGAPFLSLVGQPKFQRVAESTPSTL